MPIKQQIDIEQLVSWALECTGRLPWCRDDPRDLQMNRGCTARPTKPERVNWQLAMACAGVTWRGRQIAGKRIPGRDAEAVLAAIQDLDPAAAGLMLTYGRKSARPDCGEGIEPVMVSRTVRRGFRRSRTVRRWEPCTPQELEGMRQDYAQWHSALVSLTGALAGNLSRWEVVGPRAPAVPWPVKVRQQDEAAG